MPARFPEVSIIDQERVPQSLTDLNGDNRWGYLGSDEIVISGISGRLPESSNIEEFKENLFAGVDLVTDDERRWPAGKTRAFSYVRIYFFFANGPESEIHLPHFRNLRFAYPHRETQGYCPLRCHFFRRARKAGNRYGPSAANFVGTDPRSYRRCR